MTRGGEPPTAASGVDEQVRLNIAAAAAHHIGRKRVASARGCGVAIYGVVGEVDRSVGGVSLTLQDRGILGPRVAPRQNHVKLASAGRIGYGEGGQPRKEGPSTRPQAQLVDTE